ncbi:MAG TPA: Rrf2 family transcriptional regulator [candidate division Zixibacteria bacterium]|nr:Rrf2 family transcriptional regulator [candidate division Zixibacteria bacterium]
MRLQLTRRGDYAVRAMIVLADGAGRQLTGRELASATGIPAAFLPQVMGDLVRAGLVRTRQGRSGGYRLAREPERISLLQIVEAAEGDSRRRTCILRGGPCGAGGSHCRVHSSFFAAQEAMLTTLAQRTLADVNGA